MKDIAAKITISDYELRQCFQREYPKDLTRTTEGEMPQEYDLDRIQAEKLVGKRWDEIEADLLQEFFDVASFLNPRAFQYFLPTFIKQSQVEVEKTRLLVDSLVGMLADSGVHWPESMKHAEAKILDENPEIAQALDSINEKDLSAWREERWRLFTDQQWDLVRKWLNWIDKNEGLEVDRDILRRAMKNAENWQATVRGE